LSNTTLSSNMIEAAISGKAAFFDPEMLISPERACPP